MKITAFRKFFYLCTEIRTLDLSMERFYNVGGHVFFLSMPDDNQMWYVMENYLPFQIDAAAGEKTKCIFGITVTSDFPEGNMDYLCGNVPENPYETYTKVYALAGGYVFEVYMDAEDSNPCMLWLNSDFSTGILKERDNNGYGRFPVDNALMLTYALRTARESTLEMHASVVSEGGYGYLSLGQSGAGKSTHSRMWLENISGSRLLNDDNPIVRVFENGDVIVYGSPWSGKTPCYVNDSCKVGGFIRIVKSKSNEIHRMELLESYAALYESCSGMNLNTETTDFLHATIESVLEKIPVWRLGCLPDADAARVCHSCVKHGNIVTSE